MEHKFIMVLKKKKDSKNSSKQNQMQLEQQKEWDVAMLRS